MFTARWSSRSLRKGRGPLKFDPRGTFMCFYFGYAIGEVAAEDEGGSSTASLEVGLQLVGPFAIWTGSRGSITLNHCSLDSTPRSRLDDGFGVRRAVPAESRIPASSQPLAPMRRVSRQGLDGTGLQMGPGRIRQSGRSVRRTANDSLPLEQAQAFGRGRRICRPRSDRLLISKPPEQDTAQGLPPN